MRVAGVDVFKGRWIAVTIDDGLFSDASVVRRLPDVVDALADVDIIAVDIPIGLPPLGGRRLADDQARIRVGPRRASVFTTPPRELLSEPTLEAANGLARRHGVAGVSAQAFALRTAIFEAATIAANDERIYEFHPEVSFATAAQTQLTEAKTSWNGYNERLKLLKHQGIALPTHIANLGDGGITDVLDAAIGAWSARRIALGKAERLPAGTGRTPAIWA